jgi:hypothetical protein
MSATVSLGLGSHAATIALPGPSTVDTYSRTQTSERNGLVRCMNYRLELGARMEMVTVKMTAGVRPHLQR